VATALLIGGIIPDKAVKPTAQGLVAAAMAVKLITQRSPFPNRMLGASPSCQLFLPDLIRLSNMSLEPTLQIAVFSDDASVRESVCKALGHKLAGDLPDHSIKEFATGAALRSHVDSGKRVDLYILDGEAVPEGGLGIAKQLKDEVFNCGVVVVLVGRKSDAWLAGWSKAEGVIAHPIDPFTLAQTVAEIFRKSQITA
jgi:hypothetical protein